jgi:hypothetical protein
MDDDQSDRYIDHALFAQFCKEILANFRNEAGKPALKLCNEATMALHELVERERIRLFSSKTVLFFNTFLSSDICRHSEDGKPCRPVDDRSTRHDFCG